MPAAERADVVEVVEAAITGNHLKKILDEEGISQEELARLADISYRHGNRVVLGKSEPSLIVGLKIAAVLGRPMGKIFDIHIKTRRRRKPRAA